MTKKPLFIICISAFATFVFTFLFSLIIFLIIGINTKVQPINSNEQYTNLFETADNGLSEQNVNLVLASNEDYLTEDEKNNIAIYNALNSAVVNITTETLAYNFFLEAVPQEGGSGSGAIIDPSGIILTNTHVVDKAYKVYVTLSDGTQFEGEVLGKDTETDLAVVKIDPGKIILDAIPFGTSSNLRIGQKVLAIGNPFGYDRTLTTGIVSGLARPVRSEKNTIIQNMIQTDASINPGNSGGPLINSSGQLIGINTIIYSPTGGSVGIGFAVPVDTAKRVIPDLIEYGVVKRGWIEITPVQLNPRISHYSNLSVKKGILVSQVIKNGNAEKAGIKAGGEAVRYGRSIIYLGGDVIVEVAGQEVNGYADLFTALEDTKPNDVVKVGVIRNNKKIYLDVTLSERNASFF